LKYVEHLSYRKRRAALPILLRRRGLKARIVMMILHALWVEAPNDEESEVRRLVRRMMTTAGKLDVPLKADFS
jgi:DNA polymerase I-like protein with 3'-5' exonuclease and polymerase domains